MRKLMSVTLLFFAGFSSGGYASMDMSGTWGLEATATPPNLATPCVFKGSVQMSHIGNSISGPVILTLVSGEGSCPSEMSAQLGGNMDDGSHKMGGEMNGGALGTAGFVGTVDPADHSMAGELEVQSGPFAGATGSWRTIMMPVTAAVPTLANFGIILFFGLLLLTGGMLARRQANG